MPEQMYKSSGQIIKSAREEKQMSISDLAFELNPEDKYKLEKKIKMWEMNLDFPDFNDMYKLCEILKLNPNELLNFRTQKVMKGRRQRKFEESGIFSEEIKITIIRVIAITLILIAVYGTLRFFDVVIGSSDTRTPEEFKNAIEPYMNEVN